MNANVIKDLNYYQVDPVRGFLPKEDPLEKLTDFFDPWERVAADLSFLLMTNQLRFTLEKLPLLDVSYLEDEASMRRAFLLLSVFGNAYVWGGVTSATHIPSTIAIPWCQLAEKLKYPPIVTHASIVLDNWRRLDKTKPIELDNIATLQLFHGGLDEQWFLLTHVVIEAKGAKGLLPLVEAQRSVSLGDALAVAQNLDVILEVLVEIHTVLEQIQHKCDPYIFFHRVRPWLAGWQEPGVIYCGVSDKIQKFAGASAAQSSLIQSFDAGLGIKHQGDRQASFLLNMRSYMPPLHRKFIEALESGPSIREFAINLKSDYPVVCDLYNSCIQALENFRMKHMQIAACYISRQSTHQEKGTGGTNFAKLLLKVKQETAEYLIS